MTIRFTMFQFKLLKRIEVLNMLFSLYRKRIVAATFQPPLVINCYRKLCVTLSYSLRLNSYKILLFLWIIIKRSIFISVTSNLIINFISIFGLTTAFHTIYICSQNVCSNHRVNRNTILHFNILS